MFTPAESSIGAIFIQYATTSYMAVEGKAIGFSSLIYNLFVSPTIAGVSLLLGTALSGLYAKKYLKDFIPEYPKSESNSVLALGSVPNNAVSGLLVGLGASLGCGCTSGHMICGCSRLRLRSMVATAIFIGVGTLTSTLAGNAVSCGDGVSCASYDDTYAVYNANKKSPLLAIGFIYSHFLLPYIARKIKASGNETYRNFGRLLTGLSTGLEFGLGLVVSGMASPAKVLGFLNIFTKDRFDPSLLMIPLCVIIPTAISWVKQLPQSKAEEATKKPLLEDNYDLSFADAIDAPFLLGNAIFAVGWGLSGICPATAIIGLDFNTRGSAQWLAAFVPGYFAGKQISKRLAKSKK